MLRSTHSNQQKKNNKLIIKSSSQSPHRKLYKPSFFLRQQITNNFYHKQQQFGSYIINGLSEHKISSSRQDKTKENESKQQSKQLFNVDISKLSMKHIIAEKKKRIRSGYSKIVKKNQKSESQINKIKLKSSQKIQSQTYSKKKQLIQDDFVNIQQLHYQMVEYQQKCKNILSP